MVSNKKAFFSFVSALTFVSFIFAASSFAARSKRVTTVQRIENRAAERTIASVDQKQIKTKKIRKTRRK